MYARINSVYIYIMISSNFSFELHFISEMVLVCIRTYSNTSLIRLYLEFGDTVLFIEKKTKCKEKLPLPYASVVLFLSCQENPSAQCCFFRQLHYIFLP